LSSFVPVQVVFEITGNLRFIGGKSMDFMQGFIKIIGQ
jgi:hypothetical protein